MKTNTATTLPGIAINQRKLMNFKKKFENANYNSDNFLLGGGLATTDAYTVDGECGYCGSTGGHYVGCARPHSTMGMSRRNLDAKYDTGKLTLDQAARKISEIFGVEKCDVCEIIESKYNLEWHHAGFLPKQYGGGMRKIYYVTSDQMMEVVNGFESLYAQFIIDVEIEAQRRANEKNKSEIRSQFLKEKAKSFTRINSKSYNEKKFAIMTDCEMNGKFGWFPADSKYKLEEYYSGYEFENEADLNQYKNI